MAPPKEISYQVSRQFINCQGKKECAVVYVAPWCGACNQLLPHFKSFAEKGLTHNDYGVQIIVGAGRTPEENENKMNEIGLNTFVDPDMEIAKKLKVAYFPSVYVINNINHVLLKDQEAINWMSRHLSP